MEDILSPRRKSGELTAFFAVVLIGAAGGCGSVPPSVTSTEAPVVAETSPQTVIGREPQASSPAPEIAAVESPTSVVRDGKLSLAIRGERIERGAEFVVYDHRGKIVRSFGPLRPMKEGSREFLVISLPMRDLKPGRYVARVRNPLGRLSNAKSFTLEPEPPADSCVGVFSEKPEVIYLAGGRADDLFDRYLARNSGAADRLPRDVRIEFHQPARGANPEVLQRIALGDMEQIFVESQEDFIAKLEARLRGRIAEPDNSIVERAKNEKADYLDCPGH